MEITVFSFAVIFGGSMGLLVTWVVYYWLRRLFDGLSVVVTKVERDAEPEPPRRLKQPRPDQRGAFRAIDDN